MSSQDDTDHFNDHAEEHRPVVVSTFNKDGSIRMVSECCSCKLQQPELIEHMASMPEELHATVLYIPLQRH